MTLVEQAERLRTQVRELAEVLKDAPVNDATETELLRLVTDLDSLAEAIEGAVE